MSPYQKSYQPDSISSIEAALVWHFQVLNYNYPTLTSIESVNSNNDPIPTRVVQTGTIFLPAGNPPGWRFVGRISVPISPEFQLGTPLWANAGSFGDKQIPPQMRA